MMKHIILTILTILVLAPPVQAHNDIVVFDNVESHLDINELHEEIHHQNDSHDEKDTEHHHHCTVISLSLEFIPTSFSFQLVSFLEAKVAINFYQNTNYNSFLKAIFQPPKA